MKRFLLVVLCLMFSLFAVGCSKNGMFDKTDEIITTFDCDAEVESEGKNYSCHIFHSAEGINTVRFTQPESLADLTFSWEQKGSEVTLKELSGKFTKELLPDGSFVLGMVKALNHANCKEGLEFVSSSGEEKIFKGISESGGEYRIYVNKDGNIMRLTMKKLNLDVKFSLK